MSFAEKFNNVIHKNVNLGVRALILAISGALTGLTVAVPELGFIEWLTIVPAAIVLLRRGTDKEVKLRSIYLDGFIFFYGFYLVCYHFFLSMYPLDFIDGVTKGAAAVVVVVAWFGLSLLQSLMGALVFLFSAIFFRGRICGKLVFLKPLLVAALFAIFEWSQNFGWWGVPWGKLALGQTKYLAGIQNAAWFGSYFLTFVLVAVNCFVALALLNISNKRVLRFAAAFAVSLVAFQYGSGALIWLTTDINEGEKIRVACVQGNISASNKWDSKTLKRIESVYWEKTREAAEQGADIVVWPETAIPFNITSGLYTKYDKSCRELAKETKTYIIVGAYSNDGGGASYNSLICYTPDGERLDSVYNKRRLVPFGEFVPLRSFFEKVIPPLTDILITFDDITVGNDANIMDIEGSKVGCLICFDSIYDGLTHETLKNGAELICLSTNDSWFSGSAALKIHNSHAQLRAIESGRYVTRSASTGISTVISPRGEVLGSIDADTEGILTYDVCTRENRTLWYYLGNTFIYLCLVFFGVLLFDRFFCKIVALKKKKSLTL